MRWIAIDADFRPIRAPDGFEASSREEAEALARAHVQDTYPGIAARQLFEVVRSDGPYRLVWASRFGDDPRWHIFPREY